MKGWEIKKLGEVSDFQGGSQPPKSNFVSEPRAGYIRLLQIRDFKSDKSAVFIPITKSVKTCEADDIMIGRYGASVGQIHRGKAGAYNVALIKTIPNEDLVLKDFFYLYLISPLFQKPLASVAARSAQDGFSKEDISSFPIPLPPLPEQRRIVALLDEAFAGLETLRANAEKCILNIDELHQSQLDEILHDPSWPSKLLSEFTEINYGYTEKAQSSPVGPKFLRITDIQNGHVDWNNVPYCKITEFDKRRFSLRAGDIVFARTGATTGKSYLLVDPPEAVCASYLIRLRVVDANVLPEFVYHFFGTGIYWRNISAGISGAAQGGFNASKLGEMNIFIPSATKQKSIVDHLNRLNIDYSNLKRTYYKKLAAIDELKQSILHQAFSGQLIKSEGVAA